ncbi:MAG: electron transfer flavoprotein subunit alpha/FixB family protein [Candidatus Aureabacteria bacterium]|nr:electron transfer flavoprotein subunit alpha/FixB family protein [Candidatus Auribacterota bacterium]
MSANNVWVFIQQDNQKIAEVSIELLCKAKELADQLHVETNGVLIGHQIQEEAKKLIPYKVSEIFCVEDPRLKHYTSVPYTKIIVELIKKHKPQIVVFGATTTGRDLAPRVASHLKVGLTADCTDLQIGDHIVGNKEYKDILYQIRPAFGGNIIATIVCPETRPQMATVREGVMKITPLDPHHKGKVTAVPFSLEEKDFPSKIIEKILEEKTVDLKSAQVIVSGGMGVGSRENFELIRQLAHVLGGEVGASRAAVDAGFVSKPHQVGQTGTTVRPKLYIACGISGSIQHRAGMDQSARIIAVNSDPEAPIFQIAHYGIVGDLKEVIPLFIKVFKSKN